VLLDEQNRKNVEELAALRKHEEVLETQIEQEQGELERLRQVRMHA
jgi:hypothetical protein